MSKFFAQKKKLLEEVFEKASSSTTETSFSGILKDLEHTLLDDFNVNLSYRSFQIYYETIVINDQDYNIKKAILNDLSKYLNYESFDLYCAEWKTLEHSISERPSKIVVHVVNKPLLTMPEFLTKQSSLGVLGVLAIGGLFAGKSFLENAPSENSAAKEPLSVIQQVKTLPKTEPEAGKSSQTESLSTTIIKYEDPKKNKDCMYWNGHRYIQEYCSEAGKDLLAYNANTAVMEKVLQPDTLTVENAFGKIWYDKSHNEVSFFTAYGEHPENGKTLKEATAHILTKYGKQQTPE